MEEYSTSAAWQLLILGVGGSWMDLVIALATAEHGGLPDVCVHCIDCFTVLGSMH